MLSITSFSGAVEFAPDFKLVRRPSHVLFDFDGTLSLIREGWPQVMTPMFVEMLPPLPVLVLDSLGALTIVLAKP